MESETWEQQKVRLGFLSSEETGWHDILDPADQSAIREAARRAETAEARLADLLLIREVEQSHALFARGYGTNEQAVCRCGWSGPKGIDAAVEKRGWQEHFDCAVESARKAGAGREVQG